MHWVNFGIRPSFNVTWTSYQQKQRRYNVTIKRLRETIVAVEKN